MVHRPVGGTRANGTLTAWTASSHGQAGRIFPDEAPSFRKMVAQADSSLFKTIISNLNHVLRNLFTLRSTIQSVASRGGGGGGGPPRVTPSQGVTPRGKN